MTSSAHLPAVICSPSITQSSRPLLDKAGEFCVYHIQYVLFWDGRLSAKNCYIPNQEASDNYSL